MIDVLSGTPYPDPKDVGRDLTLQRVLIMSLMNADPEERIDGVEKLKRYELGMRIMQAKDSIELTAEEIAYIKPMIGKHFYTVVVGQAYHLLENTK